MTPQRLWTKDFLVITFENFLVAMNFLVLVSVIAKHAKDEFGASTTLGGFAAGVFILGAVFTRPLCGKWIHRVGQKRMLFAGLVLSLALTLTYFVADSAAALVAIRFVHGAVFAAAHVATGTIVTGVVPRERYGEGIGYFALSQILANALGPFIGLLVIQHSDFQAVIIAAAATTGLGLLIFPFLSVGNVQLTEGQIKESMGFKLRSFIEPKAVPIALVIMVIYLCYASVVAFLALYAEEIGMTGVASVFFIVYAFVVFLARPSVGRRFDLRGENSVMYPAIIVFAAGLTVFCQARYGWMLLIAAIINGVGFGALQSSGQTIAVKSAPPHRMGLATSTFFLFADIGVGVGPLLTGLIVTSIGFRSTFGVLAGVVAASLLLYYALHGRRASKPATALHDTQ